jgi:Tol biopolymer transport system component
MATAPFYDRVFVMNANGSGIHPAMAHPDPDISYASIADWSHDGKRILVNAVTAGNDPLLQIIDLTTGKATTVTKGAADKGAWHHRP